MSTVTPLDLDLDAIRERQQRGRRWMDDGLPPDDLDEAGGANAAWRVLDRDAPALLHKVASLTAERDRLREELRLAQASERAALAAEAGRATPVIATWEQMRHAAAERDAARASLAEVERTILQVIDERDDRGDVADKLAEAIADITGAELGEHSSMNDPWENACEAAVAFAASLAEERKRAALRDAVVEAARAWRTERNDAPFRQDGKLRLLLAAVDALEAGAAAEPDRLVIGHDGRGGRVVVEEYDADIPIGGGPAPRRSERKPTRRSGAAAGGEGSNDTA